MNENSKLSTFSAGPYSQPSDNGGGRFPQIWYILGVENWNSQWLCRGNFDF